MTTAGSLDDPSVSPETIEAWARHMKVSTVDPIEVRERLGSGNLPSAFSSMARARSTFPALTIGDRTMTHGELDRGAALAGSRLQSLGSGPGATVMLIADNGMAEVVAYLGALRTGAAVVLANPSLTGREMQQVAADSGAELAIGRGDGLRACAGDPPSTVREIIGLEESDRPTASVLLDDMSAEPMGVLGIDPDSPALLAFTSGTTGRPKCAPLSHRNLLASIRGVMWAWRWTQDDHLVHSLPISHQHGLSGVHATLLGGSRASILVGFDAYALLTEVSQGGATILFGVPAIHQRLLDDLGKRAEAFGRLRLVISGSAPLPVETAERFESVTGQRILERYGTTETGLDVSNPYEGERIRGTVGLPLPGVEVAVVDDDGRRVQAGEPGEILVRGPQVFAGYRGDGPDSFYEDWFRTGDDGTVDLRSGYLSVVGRRKELIISGGMNVYPREVEEVIRRIAAVVDVAVLGVPSERWGEEVVAFVTPANVDGGEVSSWIAGELAPYKRPKRILAIEELPRSAVGKLDLGRLRELADSSGG
jgi:malonyl-CoA/methylmalonyl-CoA synthetase